MKHSIRKVAALVGGVASLLAVTATPASAVSVSGDCSSGSATFYSVDNSGIDRSFSMRHSLSKSCGVSAQTQYKMNFGPGTTTHWKTGLRRYSNGYETGIVTDNFYIGNSAQGAWVRVCGSYSWSCGAQAYVDNPNN